MITNFTQRTEQEYIQAIEEYHGVISLVAKKLGITPTAVYKRINNNPNLQEAIKIARENFIDIAETKLQELIKEGYFPAIKYYLTTQGRDRNYGTEIQINANTRVEHKPDFSKLSFEELELLENLMKKAEGELPEGDIIEGEFIEGS